MSTTTQGPRIRSYEPAARFPRMTKIGNAVMIRLLRSRLGTKMSDLAVLTVTGRRTGRRYSMPVSVLELDGGEIVLTAAGWRVNLRGGADVELLRSGRTRTMHADLIEDPEEVATIYGTFLQRVGVKRSVRVGLRIDGAMPTHEELVEQIGGRRTVVVLRPPTSVHA